jgi:CheY-like chemotaxis protein
MHASEGHEGIILVADDNEANRELLSALLSAEGYEEPSFIARLQPSLQHNW